MIAAALSYQLLAGLAELYNSRSNSRWCTPEFIVCFPYTQIKSWSMASSGKRYGGRRSFGCLSRRYSISWSRFTTTIGLNCKVITKALPDHTLLVPMLTRNSFESFWILRWRSPTKKWPEFYIGQPIFDEWCKILATYLSSLHADQSWIPSAGSFFRLLVSRKWELWGEHSDHIHSFVQLLAEHGSLNGILDHLKQGLVERKQLKAVKSMIRVRETSRRLTQTTKTLSKKEWGELGELLLFLLR